jgi:6-bladed beta-propeller protein
MHLTERWLLRSVIVLVVAALAIGIRTRWPDAQAADIEKVEAVSTAAATREILSVSSAAFVADRWFLADARAHRVHVLDAQGHLLRSMGRRGAGPGEFGQPTVVAAAANFIYVAERARAAVSVFDSSGVFLRHLHVSGKCSSGTVVALSAVATDLYVLRRCLELPVRVRYQLERSRSGGPLHVWLPLADSTTIATGQGVPIAFPVLSTRTDRLVVGEGSRGCLRVYRLHDAQLTEERCLTELARRPLPFGERDRLTRRWRGRVQVPDSLPRFIGLNLQGQTFAVQAATSTKTTSWLEFPLIRSSAPPRPLGRRDIENSFLGGNTQLIAHDDEEGVRIEIVRVGR